MAGHDILEALSFELDVDGQETEDAVGSIIQSVEKVTGTGQTWVVCVKTGFL
jgi:hypothetical protein